MEECLGYRPCDTILLSAVLSYIEKPHDLLERIIDLGFKNIIIDRTPIFLGDTPDRLTVQHVPPHIYKARYPAWFFNMAGLLSHFKDCYETVVTFKALADDIFVGDKVAQDKGFIFKRLDSLV
jgi:putative methyltransferase (TIGR04325 family)